MFSTQTAGSLPPQMSSLTFDLRRSFCTRGSASCGTCKLQLGLEDQRTGHLPASNLLRVREGEEQCVYVQTVNVSNNKYVFFASQTVQFVSLRASNLQVGRRGTSSTHRLRTRDA